MALDPAARYASAAAMAQRPRGLARPTRRRPAAGGRRGGRRCGAAAGAPAVGAATVAAAAARPNPVPYPADAYARSAPPAPVTTQRRPAAAARPRPTATPRTPTRATARGPGSPACSASLILLVVGFLVFQMLTGGGDEPTASAEPVGVGRRGRASRGSST